MSKPSAGQFVSIGIGHYAESAVYPDLPVTEEIRKVRKILEPLGLDHYAGWRTSMARRGGDAVRARLRQWEQSPADVAVLYWVGHGWSNGETTALVHAKSPRAAGNDGVSPKDLASAISRWSAAGGNDAAVVIVILDACRSGGFVDQLNTELSGQSMHLLLIGTATEDASTRLPGFRHVLDFLFDKVYKGCESVNLADLAIQVELHSASTLPVYPLARRVADRSLPLHWPHNDDQTKPNETLVLGASATKDRQLRKTAAPLASHDDESAAGKTTNYRLARPSPTRTWSRDVMQIHVGPPALPEPASRQLWITNGTLSTRTLAPPEPRTTTPLPYQRLVVDAHGCTAEHVADALLGQLGGGGLTQDTDRPSLLGAALDAQKDRVMVVARGVTEAADVPDVVALLRTLATRPDTEVLVEPGASATRPADALFSTEDIRRFNLWASRQYDPSQRALLVALALALGPGLPLRDRVLCELAEAVAKGPVSVDLAATERFCSSGGPYLTRTVIDNQAVYRLAKDGYRKAVLGEVDAAVGELQLLVAQRCLDLASTQAARAEADGLNRQKAVNPYLRRWTKQHALLAGPAGEDWLAAHIDELSEYAWTVDQEPLAPRG